MTQAGFFGKHPGFGDFIAHGVPVPLREELEAWLTETLARTKQHLGAIWEQVYDAARPVRFWIGPSVLTDKGALRGVIWPSRDSVGRRYPLVMLAADTQNAPPPIVPDQSFFEETETRLADAMHSAAKQPAGLMALDGFGTLNTPETDTMWAVNPDDDLPGLLRATGAADYTRAASNRSYWWTRADAQRSGAIWSCTGLPTADAMAWLLSGVVAPATEPTPEDDQTIPPKAETVPEEPAP